MDGSQLSQTKSYQESRRQWMVPSSPRPNHARGVGDREWFQALPDPIIPGERETVDDSRLSQTQSYQRSRRQWVVPSSPRPNHTARAGDWVIPSSPRPNHTRGGGDSGWFPALPGPIIPEEYETVNGSQLSQAQSYQGSGRLSMVPSSPRPNHTRGAGDSG